mgnify:CR=1 FL=1
MTCNHVSSKPTAIGCALAVWFLAPASGQQLPKDLGLSTVPKITGQNLRDWKGLGHVTVAEDSGLLLGACLWALTVSSWRGAKGIYVSDVYVMSHARGRKVGEKLLRGVAKEAEKLGFGQATMPSTNEELSAGIGANAFQPTTLTDLVIRIAGPRRGRTEG